MQFDVLGHELWVLEQRWCTVGGGKYAKDRSKEYPSAPVATWTWDSYPQQANKQDYA